VEGKPFASGAELKAWLDAEGFPEDLKTKVYDTVPNTIMVGKDVVLCLDFNTGKELWKWEQPGKPTGRKSSSTCAVVDGKVFAMLSSDLVCVNEADGKLVWKAALPGKGPGSSPPWSMARSFATRAAPWLMMPRTGSSYGSRRPRAATPPALLGGRPPPVSPRSWCRPATSCSA